MTSPLRIGVAGLGTVGAAVCDILLNSQDLLGEHVDRTIALCGVSARDREKDRGVDLTGVEWFEDPVILAKDPGIDVFVELIGGDSGPAYDAVSAALARGTHVVTANKALIAAHGVDLALRAEESGAQLSFEAAVAGGIPIIRTLREGLTGNRIDKVFGILNGTSNFILTEMEKSSRPFADVLKEAQAKGYAEADPTFDIEGQDTAHKLCILAALGFGIEVSDESLCVEGISLITPEDIRSAGELGYRIKLLGYAARKDGDWDLRVHPAFVLLDSPLGAVDGVTNAVVLESSLLGQLVLEGPGAGGQATASSVVADVCSIALEKARPAFGRRAASLRRTNALPIGDIVGAFYLRLTVQDKPGVLARITDECARHDISFATVLQRGTDPDGNVPIVVVTHACQESAMDQAIATINEMPETIGSPKTIRIVDL